MRRFKSLIGVACCACCLSAAGAEITPADGVATNAWFPPIGEELVYRVYWGIIPIGKAGIVTRWAEKDGRKLLSIRYRARSNRVLAFIYPVDDSIETLIDPVTFLPVRYSLNLKEGRHRNHEITTFDHPRLTATWRSLIKGTEKVLQLESDTRDLVAFLCFMRQRHFEPDEKLQFRIMADEKLYDLWLQFMQYETVKLPGFGKIQSLRIEPSAAFNGLFVRKGKMWVWVSNDRRNVFTQIEASLPVANVRAILSAVHGPQEDFWTQKTKELLAAGKIEKDDPEVEQSLKELSEAPKGQ